jgi:magnesium transporter
MLINCALYKQGKKIKDIAPDEVTNDFKEDNEFVWAAFVDPQPNEIEKLCTMLGVHELALEDVRHGSQMPKMEEYDEHIFIVIKQMMLIATDEIIEEDMYIFTGPHYVVTVRKNKGPGFTSVRKRSERQSKLLSLGPSYVVYSIMDTIVDRYFPVINQLEKDMDVLEREMFSEDTSSDKSNIIKRFHLAKEKIRSSKLVIFPTTEFMSKLFGGRVPDMFEGMDNYFRDIHDHLLRISAILDALNETATSGVHTSVALIAIEDSKVTKKLASWAAIFGASTLMAGVWGMNFKHMPELEWQYGYLFALSTIGFVALFLYRKFKKAGWM